MAILHQATLSPTKDELLAEWLPTQPWAGDGPWHRVGAYRFDDPAGEVGLEVHLLEAAGTLIQIPLTYRGEARADDAGLVTTMSHSALGTRWVYDAMADPAFVPVLAAATLTGTGQALGMVQRDGHWTVVPSTVRLVGASPVTEPVVLGEFALPAVEADGWSTTVSETATLRLARRPVAAGANEGPALLAVLPDGVQVVLAEITIA